MVDSRLTTRPFGLAGAGPRRTARALRLATVVVAAWAGLAYGPVGINSPAHAATTYTYTEGVEGQPFRLADVPAGMTASSGDDPRIMLELQEIWSITTPPWADGAMLPRSVDYSDTTGDRVLFSDQRRAVGDVSRSGGLPWWFTPPGQSEHVRLFSAQRLADGNTLVCDRRYTNVAGPRVYEVTPDGEIVWRYGFPGATGLGVNRLADPFHAVRLDPLPGQTRGDTLIVDTKDAYRVLRIRSDDYDPDAPETDMGYTDESVTLVYGRPGTHGDGLGQLEKPHGVQMLGDGTYFVTDSGESDPEPGSPVVEPRLLWIDAGGDAVDSLGPPDVDGGLNDPTRARVLEDRGSILIADTRNNRVVEVDRDGRRLWQYGSGSPAETARTPLYEPRDAVRQADGRTLIADTNAFRVVEVGYPTESTATSIALDCGSQSAKLFRSIDWATEMPDPRHRVGAQAVQIDYSIDGRSWRSAGSSGHYRLPDDTTSRGQTIRYRVHLRTADRARTPVLTQITIAYRRWTESARGGGDTGPSESGSGTTGGITSMESGQPAGTGTGGSGGGTGGGQGTGSGVGTGPGRGGSSVSSAGGPAGAAGAVLALDPETVSPADGPLVGVTGTRVALGGPSLAPGPTGGGGPDPVAGSNTDGAVTSRLSLVLLAVGLGLVASWPLVHRGQRRLTEFDHAAAQATADAAGYIETGRLRA